LKFSLQKAADISGIAGKIRRLSLHDAGPALLILEMRT
jgi:hypothetical protein